jgi:hypothetical protein
MVFGVVSVSPLASASVFASSKALVYACSSATDLADGTSELP